jgi:hypothetical protein
MSQHQINKQENHESYHMLFMTNFNVLHLFM